MDLLLAVAPINPKTGLPAALLLYAMLGFCSLIGTQERAPVKRSSLGFVLTCLLVSALLVIGVTLMLAAVGYRTNPYGSGY